jgi:hypothetical protein
MGEAKDIVLKAITSKRGNDFIRANHYSGKVVNNSQLHIGVFKGGVLGGVLQFGCSLDKRKIQGLVKDTGWNEFIELNRMAFTDLLPRNSESRAIAISMRLLKKYAPHIKWVISFADATQCGDGTIYRASGFVLTGIKKNTQIWEKDGNSFSRMSLTDGKSKQEQKQALKIVMATIEKGNNILQTGSASMKVFKDAGFKPAKGFQLRYIYFIDKTCRQKLTVPEIPFGRIQEMGASMYKGKNAALV